MQKILITLQKTKNLSLLTMRTQILNRWLFVALLVIGIILLSSCKPETITSSNARIIPNPKSQSNKNKYSFTNFDPNSDTAAGLVSCG